MAVLSMVNKKLSAINADAIVLGCVFGDNGPEIVSDGVEPVDATLTLQLAGAAKQLGITGAPDDVHAFPAPAGYQAKVVVLTGLGKPPASGEFSAETLRRAAGAATRQLNGSQSAAVALPTPDEASLAAVAEGSLLGAYSYDQYRKPSDVKSPLSHIDIVSPLRRSSRAQAAFARAEIIANAVAQARDWTDTPPNVLYPASFASLARKAASRLPQVKVTVLAGKELEAGGYEGLIAVGKGSTRGPRLVVVSYQPENAVGKVGLVGKGITFDSGGISLKPGEGLKDMTLDMAGAAGGLATVIAAAQLDIPVAGTGYLCLAENMPSGDAARPGDIISYRNGLHVEIDNTDAEGRLVLADGLIDAVRAGVDVVIDVATLTGAQIIALGTRTSGVMGTPEVRDAIVRAANESGEMFWPMPLPDELKSELKTKLADISNIAPDKSAGMLVGATFLREFVGDTPWAHIDIAGPAFNTKAAWGYTPKGGTGVGVRALVTFLEDFARSPKEFKNLNPES
ncbi:MAG: leucyl aminopeptidase [Promicromonosporaceae bacterium]|nr:leucyl aminopeptidase [Promicromonosporaceae bacterium]